MSLKKRYKKINNDKSREIFQLKNFLEKTNIDKETKDFTKELLFLAWTDLISSGILYRRKLYNQAVYFLQQSLEKTTKAEYLRDGTLNIGSIKKDLGHKSYLAFNKDCLNDFIELAKHKEKTKNNLPHIKDFFENQFQKGKNKEKANLILSFLPEKILKNLIKNLGHRSKEKIGNLKIIGSDFLKKKEKEKYIISLREELWILSQLLSIHESLTRYPNKELNPSDYNKNIPLIKIFPEIHHKLMDILSILDIETLKQLLKSNHLDD